MSAMHKIGVVGERDAILGFKSLGLDVFAAYEEEEISNTLNTLARNDYAVIFITEETAMKAKDTIDKYTSRPFPAIILIPGAKGSTGIGMMAIKESVEKAIGTDILFKED